MTRAGYRIIVASADGSAGYVGGTSNGIALTLEFTSRREDVSKTICIDTTQAITAWEWTCGAEQDFPTWDNRLGFDSPRCWEIFYMECDSQATAPGVETAPASGTGCSTCCRFHLGDVNEDGSDGPTIADISALIDAVLVKAKCDLLTCIPECDFNRSGGVNPDCRDLTIADLSSMIDYLFITGPTRAVLPECP